jgi:hypothetical protein
MHLLVGELASPASPDAAAVRTSAFWESARRDGQSRPTLRSGRVLTLRITRYHKGNAGRETQADRVGSRARARPAQRLDDIKSSRISWRVWLNPQQHERHYTEQDLSTRLQRGRDLRVCEVGHKESGTVEELKGRCKQRNLREHR